MSMLSMQQLLSTWLVYHLMLGKLKLKRCKSCCGNCAVVITMDVSNKNYNKFQKRKPTKVRLSGYGVELAIKNQEYKAKDDTKVQSE